MDIALSDAKAQLTDLVRRAEAGEEIVLTRHGTPVARIAAIKPQLSPEQKKARIDAIRASVRTVPDDGVSAARSRDFLYDESGLPK
ncbi:type II toxin-antitoxin system prevent-host-death family antitoxin [Devosia sp. A8/3-2]|nr:type II toxin-antitoxin system prevent-host-death family antitoxin [Devosia sp. A8/3-2]